MTASILKMNSKQKGITQKILMLCFAIEINSPTSSFTGDTAL